MQPFIRLVAAAATAVVLSAPAHAELKNLTIGTNPSGSAFFLLGGALAKLFQEELGIRATAQPQGGTSVFLPMVGTGEMTLGVSSNIDAGLAYRGELEYPQPVEGLRAVGRIWLLPYAFVTRADSGIVTMEDLRGKRVMGDMPTSIALTQINKAMLKAGGLSVEDVDFARSGGVIDGINAVSQGRADAAPVATSMPALTETHASTPLRIIADGMGASDEFYAAEVPGVRTFLQTPSERRPYVVKDTPIVMYDTLVVTSEAQSADDVYQLTKTMYENWEQLQQDYPMMRELPQEAVPMVDPTIPYHQGAIDYYKEVGLWTDAHEAHQDKF